MGIVIFFLVLFGIVGGVVFAVLRVLKQTDTGMTGVDLKDSLVSTAQEFLPYNDIKDGVIDLGSHKYRVILECSSTNYNLKTNQEKEIIEMSFQRFLNSLTFPITFYVQTKVIDDSKMIMQLEEDLITTIDEYPNLQTYADVYFQEMKNLHNYIGNNKAKRKYIIIPFEDTDDLVNLNDKEKYEYALKEIQTRANIMIDSLSTIGVKSVLLDNSSLVELIYSIYHKDDYSSVEHLISGEYLETIIEGQNKLQTLEDVDRADWILYEAQMRIKNEILSKALTDEEDGLYAAIIDRLEEVRERVEDLNKSNVEEEVKEDEEDEWI